MVDYDNAASYYLYYIPLQKNPIGIPI
jgi:hypothetical protein